MEWRAKSCKEMMKREGELALEEQGYLNPDF